jgi:hypothetical protein
MSLPKSILIASLLFAGCASQQAVPEQATETSLGSGGLTIKTIEPAPAPGEAAGNPSEEAKWQRIEEFLANQRADGIDAKEMLGLWDDQGKFRTEYWESLTHKRRTHCVAVLALCGNGGAIRAQAGSLSEDALRQQGPYIANGTFGTRPRSYLERPGDPDPFPSRPGGLRIKFGPEFLPDWRLPDLQAISSAIAKGLPLVIYFPGEFEAETAWADTEMVKLSKESAVFIKVPFNEDREQAVKSIVPDSKILRGNPSRDYAVPVDKDIVIVADGHGNEYFRYLRVPEADELEKLLDQVPNRASQLNEKLAANLEKAQARLEKGERREALKYILKNFREAVVGLHAQLDTIDLYVKLIEEGHAELTKLADAGDKDGLKALSREFADTDLEKEINEALAKLK